MATFMNFTSEDAVNLNGVPSLAGAKRSVKNTRRVNTAERRASHNQVERQRREALNGRFLDLAALLPNLNTIRRPSKASIVNSSIAHLNASRRHRLQAAQQLRLVKDEADALRHELNQWRHRAGVTGLEEPMRAEAFGVVLSGELEFEQSDLLDGSEEGDDEDGGYRASLEDYAMHRAQMIAAQQAQIHAYPVEPVPVSPQSYYASSPTIVDPAHAIAYENPAAAYAPYQQHPAEMEQWAYEKQRRMSMSMLQAQQQHQAAAGW